MLFERLKERGRRGLGHTLLRRIGPEGARDPPTSSQRRCRMEVWYERSAAKELENLARAVTITDENRSLGTIRVAENPTFTLTHKNKYGQDYVPPASGITY